MTESICTKCKESKDTKEEFYYGKGKRQIWCKECQKAYAKEWHATKRDIINKSIKDKNGIS